MPLLSSETYTAGWDSTSGDRRIGYYRLSQRDHQLAFESMAGTGYRPVTIGGHQDMFGGSRFCSLWEKTDGRAWGTNHGIAIGDFQSLLDRQKREGMRPVFISCYGGSRGVFVNAIWERDDGPVWNAQFGIAEADYQRLFDDRQREKLRPRSVSPYVADGKFYYATVWDNTPSAGWTAHHGMSLDAFNTATDNLNAAGRALISGGSARSGNREIFAGIWVVQPGARCQSRQAMDLETLLNVDREMRANGLEIRSVSSTAYGSEKEALLNFTMQRQGKSNWCWVACASSIANYYGKSTGHSQCDLVNLDFGRSDCCGSDPATNDLPCNNGGDAGRILGKIHMLNRSAGRLTYAAIETELLANRPIAMHLGWTGGGEHVVVMTGCQTGQLIRLSDPSNGQSRWEPYSQMTNNTVYNWMHSALTRRP
jgi:hypothetical protein